MTELLQLAEHRLPDGARPLLIGRPIPALSARVVERDTEPLTCLTLLWAGWYGGDVPASCRRTITVGEHYLEHVDLDGAGHRRSNYCAPCAVREAHWWDVTEAAGA